MDHLERIALAVAAACILALTWIAWSTTSAKAESPPSPIMTTIMPRACFDTKEIEAHLLKKFNEIPSAAGLDDDGSLVRVFSSPEKSFTVMVTKPGGISCVVDIGAGWEINVPEVAGDKT